MTKMVQRFAKRNSTLRKDSIRSSIVNCSATLEAVKRIQPPVFSSYQQNSNLQTDFESTEERPLRRADFCKELLQITFDNRFIKRIVTCDGKWIYFRNPDTSNQWLDICQTSFLVRLK